MKFKNKNTGEIIEWNPIMINSALLSAQNRKRLYWTNIPNIKQPEDKGILLKDIIEMNDSTNGVFNAPASIVGRRLNNKGVRDDYNKDVPITQCLQVKHTNDKMGCLTTVGKDNVLSVLPPGRYPVMMGAAIRGRYNEDNKIEQKLELRKDEKTNSLTTVPKDNVLCKMVGMAELNTHDVRRRVYSIDGKSPTITTASGGYHAQKIPVNKTEWRYLTPLEYERLQTVPDHYTDGISNSQRYRCLGNGWTADVIAHIFKKLRKIYPWTPNKKY